jgi:hypothetical protein
MLKTLPFVLGFLILMSGCDTTYRDAKRYVEPGGQGDREIQQRRDELAREQLLQQQRRDEVARNSADLQSIRNQTQKAEFELRSQARQLDAALNAGKLTRERHSALSGELSKIQMELWKLERDSQESANRPRNLDSSALTKRKLAELEERKKALERTLSQLNTVR